MFAEMGFRDTGVLDRVEGSSREYFSEAIRIGRYRGWLAEELNGQNVGGGGIVVADWPGYPGENHAERAWILNIYTEPEPRRCGVAKRLLEVMIEWCRTRRFSAVSPHASSAGRPLYEKVCFQQTNEMMLKLP
jgi:GNAT superfamily N-acetyltransferase